MNNDFNDLKNLWQSQAGVSVPNVEGIKKAAIKNRRRLMRKNIIGLLTLGFTLVFICWIGLAAEFKYPTTKAGIVMIVVAIIGGMAVNTQLLFTILKTADATTNNKDYLEQLISYRDKQRAFQTKGIVAYYLLLTIGFIFYLYEFYAINHAFGIKAYVLTLLWIGFAWFYIRPRTIKKQEQKINEMIDQIRQVSGQLND